jgi:hypothetical protein
VLNTIDEIIEAAEKVLNSDPEELRPGLTPIVPTGVVIGLAHQCLGVLRAWGQNVVRSVGTDSESNYPMCLDRAKRRYGWALRDAQEELKACLKNCELCDKPGVGSCSGVNAYALPSPADSFGWLLRVLRTDPEGDPEVHPKGDELNPSNRPKR